MSSRRLVASSSRRGRGTGLAEERKASPVTAPGRLRPPWCYVWLRDQVWRVCISPRVWWCAEFLLLAPAIRTNDCRGAGGPPVPPRPLWRPLLKRRMHSPSFCPPRVVPVCALRGKKRKGCGRGALASLVRLRGSPPRAAAAAALAFFSRPASPSGAALGRPAAGRRVVCRLFGAWWVLPCLRLLFVAGGVAGRLVPSVAGVRLPRLSLLPVVRPAACRFAVPGCVRGLLCRPGSVCRLRLRLSCFRLAGSCSWSWLRLAACSCCASGGACCGAERGGAGGAGGAGSGVVERRGQ